VWRVSTATWQLTANVVALVLTTSAPLQDTTLEKEVNLEFIEFGNALVLFFAGLSVRVEDVAKYWRAFITVGLGYTAFTTVR